MKLVLIIILLFCFSLQAQQKRWQLDSIQQIQFRSDKKEYVYQTLHQSYNPKRRIVTKIDDKRVLIVVIICIFVNITNKIAL